MTLKFGPRTVAAGLVGLGAALRVWQWSAGRSLSIDEAAVALGLLGRPLGSLVGAHDFGQISPPGWLALARGSAAGFGPGELALRLPTLVLAVLYLPALWILLRKFVPPAGALVGLAVAALSPALLDYGSILKPYGSDPVVTVVILLLVLSVLTRERVTVGRGLVVGAALGTLTWLSVGAIIVAVGSASSLFLRRRPIRDRAGEIALVATTGVGFGAAYWLHYRPEPWLARYLGEFWGPRFLAPGAPDLAGRWGRTIREVLGPSFVGHGGDLLPVLLLLVIAFGAVRVGRRLGHARLALLLGPVAGFVALAAVGAYPVGNRLTLFLVPCLTVLLAAGWDAIAERIGLTGSSTGLTIAGYGSMLAILLVPPGSTVLRLHREQLTRRPHARPIVREMLAGLQAGDPVYVYARAIPEWWFYTTDWRDPDLSRIERVGKERRAPDGQPFGAVLPDSLLTIRTVAGLEVYGRYSGFQRTARAVTPDSGWAAAEATRLAAIGSPCLWLVELQAGLPERAALARALEARGFAPVEQLTSGTSSIKRVCRSSGGS